jgi:hypothetical protein
VSLLLPSNHLYPLHSRKHFLHLPKSSIYTSSSSCSLKSKTSTVVRSLHVLLGRNISLHHCSGRDGRRQDTLLIYNIMSLNSSDRLLLVLALGEMFGREYGTNCITFQPDIILPLNPPNYSAGDHPTSSCQPSRGTVRVPTYDFSSVKECLCMALHVCRLRRFQPRRTGPYF